MVRGLEKAVHISFRGVGTRGAPGARAPPPILEGGHQYTCAPLPSAGVVYVVVFFSIGRKKQHFATSGVFAGSFRRRVTRSVGDTRQRGNCVVCVCVWMCEAWQRKSSDVGTSLLSASKGEKSRGFPSSFRSFECKASA